MFGLFALVIAGPLAVIVAIVVVLAARGFKLLPAGMSYGWLILSTVSLVAGGLTMAAVLGEFIIRPIQLQNEVAGHQIVSPLTLRAYVTWGFQDQGWNWRYVLDPETEARLRRNCRPDPPTGNCLIGSGGEPGRSVGISIRDNELTIEEALY